jgi:hypothetical protein
VERDTPSPPLHLVPALPLPLMTPAFELGIMSVVVPQELECPPQEEAHPYLRPPPLLTVSGTLLSFLGNRGGAPVATWVGARKGEQTSSALVLEEGSVCLVRGGDCVGGVLPTTTIMETRLWNRVSRTPVPLLGAALVVTCKDLIALTSWMSTSL